MKLSLLAFVDCGEFEKISLTITLLQYTKYQMAFSVSQALAIWNYIRVWYAATKFVLAV